MAEKIIQQQSKAGDNLYPVIHADSIPADAVTTEKVKDNSVTEPKLSAELDKKITDSKTVTDTLMEGLKDPDHLEDPFVRAGLIPIPFEDAEAKRILVENYDKDGDGELSYDEAQKTIKKISIYDGIFQEDGFYHNTKIRSFNEFRFFDSVKEVGSPSNSNLHAFEGCTNLESIELPENVTRIDGFAFRDCTKLKIRSKKLPKGLSLTNECAFLNCQSLELDELPSGLTTLPSRIFEGCSSLALTELPEGIKTLRNSCFKRAKVSFSKLPDSLTEINGEVFSNTQVSFTEFPDSLTSIGGYALSNCHNLTKLTFPEGLTSIGQMAFCYCDSLKELTMKGSTPPTLGSQAFIGTTKLTVIYVPDDAVDAYKEATEWVNYANIIKPVSEKPATT